MIKIKVKSRGEKIIAVDIKGHAVEEAEAIIVGEAYDMICNSVSVLSQSLLIGLESVLNINCSYEIYEGYISLDLTDLEEDELTEAQTLLKTFELSIDSIMLSLEQSFGKKKRDKYICLLKEEV
ncbi:ribosomal-processing cysteine protease Prp [Clostridium sp. 'White wine YQ']|uniref:ribosomal-processing cysteine protease Prp n=1 Tax=Clostridium sp. 'White wine YQ' TaxID=3027474 RepID=UPI0023660AC6|nr:ribosomal-processing cysteine protease Prp [Clostridium sp. 'White wine YQ']MDD7794871.1 ribosomal-processing cysteine protease Prp [Clostridium sp. 'White wine YQ']